MKVGLLLMKNKLKWLAASAANSASFCSGDLSNSAQWIIIISNEEMEYIMKIVESLEEHKTVLAKEWKIEQKNKGTDFLVCY